MMVDIKENAIVDVTFRGQIIQLKSGDGEATGTLARYSCKLIVVVVRVSKKVCSSSREASLR